MLASVAASLRSHSRPGRLHVARLKRYFIEVWGRSGRRPSSHRGHIFCPIRPIPSLDGRPLQPCDPARSQNVYLLCAPFTGPRWPPLSLWIFLHRSCREGLRREHCYVLNAMLLFVFFGPRTALNFGTVPFWSLGIAKLRIHFFKGELTRGETKDRANFALQNANEHSNPTFKST